MAIHRQAGRIPGRVLPAREGLEADDPCGPQVVDRLVVDDQLVAFEGGPQLGFDVEALAGMTAAERVEHRNPARRMTWESVEAA